MNKQDYLTIKEIIEISGVCPATAMRWVREKKFKLTRQPEVYRCNKISVMKFLEKREARRKELEEKKK